MTDRALVITGFAVLAFIVTGTAITARVRRVSFAGLGDTVRYLTRTRTARIVAVILWAWLGWHFLAR
ncbi:hypothetical protein J2W56_002641 [Nocardia kruczakiae]|uniref:Uncharacterized protein n=1 Tax=Nocardia kruczakiae TaxID=261477 RepID=A0ABU1XEF6_9NOCA|nr:DUF6186 family protein [Nocardia kruczakiae]MDR7168910.1 hypothetical protein [Nocardia kruczakiae]